MTPTPTTFEIESCQKTVETLDRRSKTGRGSQNERRLLERLTGRHGWPPFTNLCRIKLPCAEAHPFPRGALIGCRDQSEAKEPNPTLPINRPACALPTSGSCSGPLVAWRRVTSPKARALRPHVSPRNSAAESTPRLPEHTPSHRLPGAAMPSPTRPAQRQPPRRLDVSVSSDVFTSAMASSPRMSPTRLAAAPPPTVRSHPRFSRLLKDLLGME